MENKVQTARMTSLDESQEIIASLLSRESLEIYIDLDKLEIDQKNEKEVLSIPKIIKNFYKHVSRCDMIVVGPIKNDYFGRIIAALPCRTTHLNYEDYCKEIKKHLDFSFKKRNKLY